MIKTKQKQNSNEALFHGDFFLPQTWQETFFARPDASLHQSTPLEGTTCRMKKKCRRGNKYNRIVWDSYMVYTDLTVPLALTRIVCRACGRSAERKNECGFCIRTSSRCADVTRFRKTAERLHRRPDRPCELAMQRLPTKHLKIFRQKKTNRFVLKTRKK